MSITSLEPRPGPWERWGWAMAAIFLFFLVYPVIAAAEADAPVAVRVLTVAALIGFGVLYVVGFGPLSDRPALVGVGLLALGGATIPVIGVQTVGLTPYIGMFAALCVPRPWWPWATGFAALLPLFSLLGRDDFPVFFFLTVWPIMVAGVLIRLFTERERTADKQRAAYALVAERERVARDVHDVLGHSLTALSVKAELAARLIDVDPDRARDELASIQETARQALAEVRATVGGLRAGNLEAELAAAPRVLADAGIETRVVGEVADTDPRQRAMLAWVLRESVTNVVRHADATSVVIELGPHGLTVTDDGAGFSGAEGNGLRGMRERVSAAGGTLQLSGGPGTRVQVVLP